VSNINKALLADINEMVSLSKQKRVDYARHQPLFWKKASESETAQATFFASLIEMDDVISLVYREKGSLKGFLIAFIKKVPPVYDIDGLSCHVDDFVVIDPNQWEIIGKALLIELLQLARDMGAVQIVVICGYHDTDKRKLLDSMDLTIASMWYTKPIT